MGGGSYYRHTPIIITTTYLKPNTLCNYNNSIIFATHFLDHIYRCSNIHVLNGAISFHNLKMKFLSIQVQGYSLGNFWGKGVSVETLVYMSLAKIKPCSSIRSIIQLKLKLQLLVSVLHTCHTSKDHTHLGINPDNS